jgi:hypothetical protein
LCSPIAPAIVIPVASARRRTSRASVGRGDAGGTGGEAGREQREQRDHVAQARVVVLDVLQRRRDDLLAVARDVHEDEREDAHGEHRERDPHAVVDPLDAPERQAEVDREARDRAQQHRLRKVQIQTPSVGVREA